MSVNGYPHPSFLINDGSAETAVADVVLDGLFIPLFFTFGAKGLTNRLQYTGGSSAVALLGSATFDTTGPYFNHQTRFLQYAAARQGAYFVRLIDPAAATAGLVVQITTTPKSLTQYQLDSLGNRILDDNGNPKPQLQADNTTPVTQPGLSILWSVRALAANEDYTSIKSTTTQNQDGSTSTTYPIMALLGKYAGQLMNNWGFKLYRPSPIDTTTESNINSVLYRLAPYFLDTTLSTTASPIGDVNGSAYNDFSFKPTATDPDTAKNWALKSVIRNQYFDSNKNPMLDMNIYTYGANVQAIGQQVLTLSPELASTVTDGYMIDLINGNDENGLPYEHMVVDPASTTVVSSAAIQYLQGGTDGDTSNEMFESLVQSYITSATTGEFRNIARFPFTHVIDSGFTMNTKYSMLSLLALRNNLKVILSTQDVSRDPNTESEDISAAQALMARASLYPEATVTNTGVMRCSIYYHCGELSDATAYDGIIPLTLARLATLCAYDGGTYITDDPGGFPGSIVTLFDPDTINWVPNSSDEMANAWANGANYVLFADRTVIFYPSLRTVYNNDTSLLSDDPFTDRILYMFKILFLVWATYSGKRMPSKSLFPIIEKDANARIAKAFGTGITATVTLTQTALDAQLGYATDAIVQVSGAEPMRVMNFRFMIGRSTS